VPDKKRKMAGQVTIMFFGQLAQLAGTDRIQLSDIDDTQQLRQRVNGMYPSIQHIEYAIAVEKKIINENVMVNDSDTIALLPPFSGG
jgi:molybdopterin converting factor small subunit